MFVLPRWPLVFAVVCNDLRALFGRPFILVFALRKSPGGHHAEHCDYQYLSDELHHFSLFLLVQVPAQEGERDALTSWLQERCHVFSNENSNKMRGNSHGFELSRTVSCKEQLATKGTKAKMFIARDGAHN